VAIYAADRARSAPFRVRRVNIFIRIMDTICRQDAARHRSDDRVGDVNRHRQFHFVGQFSREPAARTLPHDSRRFSGHSVCRDRAAAERSLVDLLRRLAWNWRVRTSALYGLADACWLPAAAIQMKAVLEAQAQGAGFSMRQNAGVCLAGG
jgi:hypothetical protein